MSRGIAFFDFDGTVTTHDTLIAFIRFSRGPSALVRGFLLHSFPLVAYKLQLLSNQVAKEKILAHFFRGMPEAEFNAQCQRFQTAVLPSLLRPAALREMDKLRNEGFRIVIVSASPENWIRDWASETGVELIASRLEVKDHRLTGKLLGRNCHGAEKVRRILEHHAMNDYDVIHAYGDTHGDRPMLRLATHPFYRPFRAGWGQL